MMNESKISNALEASHLLSKWLILPRVLSTLLLAVCIPQAGASPTSNQFEACHKQAAAVLYHCLEKRAGHKGKGDECWQESKQHNQACYSDLFESHKDFNSKEAAAERAAKAKLKPYQQ